jgi:uncharacterized protein DUF4956
VSELFGSDVVNWLDLGRLLARLFLDLAFATVVVRLIYYRLYRNREYVFTYFLFNVITFCLCLVLRKVSTHIGLALALFGVFGILRYRTEQIRIRDLTYLFIVIGIGVLNAFADQGVSLAELLAVNVVIVGMTAVLELGSSKNVERSTLMCYDQLELLQPGNEAKLVADISARTGLAVVRVEITRVDMLRDAADIVVFHRQSRSATVQ